MGADYSSLACQSCCSIARHTMGCLWPSMLFLKESATRTKFDSVTKALQMSLWVGLSFMSLRPLTSLKDPFLTLLLFLAAASPVFALCTLTWSQKLLFEPNQNPYHLGIPHLQLFPNASSPVSSEIDTFIYPPKWLFHHGVSYTNMPLAAHKAPVWYLMLPSRDTMVCMFWNYFTCLSPEEINTDPNKMLIRHSSPNLLQTDLRVVYS